MLAPTGGFALWFREPQEDTVDINQNAKRIVDTSTQEPHRQAKRVIDAAAGDRSPLMDMLDVEPPAPEQPAGPETAEAKLNRMFPRPRRRKPTGTPRTARSHRRGAGNGSSAEPSC